VGELVLATPGSADELVGRPSPPLRPHDARFQGRPEALAPPREALREVRGRPCVPRAARADPRRSARLGKYALFLTFVRRQLPISRRTLIPRALVVPISRGTFLPRSVASSRAALAGPISHGTFLPRALVETRGALFAGRGSIGASTSRGTNVPRARDTSICAARVPRASLGLCTAQRRGVPRARTISTARGMLIPRDEPHNTPPFNKAATSAGAATSAASP